MREHRWLGREALLLLKVTHQQDPIAAIERLAASLIHEAGLDGPPLRPEVLASFRDVHEIRRREMPGAARLLPEDGGLVIEVNASHPLGKQNFSIDHEIAHTLLPSYEGWLVDDEVTGEFQIDKEDEYLCDVGAAALLLDPRWLRPLALDSGASLHTLFKLASLFGASLQATSLQLSRLNIWPCAFVFWEEGYRKSDRACRDQGLLPGMEAFGAPHPKLRVACAYFSPSFGHYIPKNKSVSDSSIFAQCHQTHEPRNGIEDIDTGHESLRSYSESVYAPYGSGSSPRGRVISLLLPVDLPSSHFDPSTVNYQLEML